MPKTKFHTGEYYHVYNRGVDKRELFLNISDFKRFITGMRVYNQQEPVNSLSEFCKTNKLDIRCLVNQTSYVSKEKIVEIICYCVNPNHFHFILKQLSENGAAKFIKKCTMSYTKYFNAKHGRSGVLFQGRTKAVHIQDNSRLLWLSGYVNGNSEIHKIEKAENYIWSSCSDYLGTRNGTFCDNGIIMEQFNNSHEDYRKFMKMVIKESRERRDMEKLLLE